MAVPALIGIGALWTALQTALSGIVVAFFTTTGKRIAVITLVIGALYLAVTVLFSLMSSYATPLLQSLPPELSTIGSFLPTNTIACLTAIIAVEIGCITYSLTVKALEIQTKVV